MYLPSWQLLHFDFPVWSKKVPAKQSEHPVDPDVSSYFPLEHGMHADSLELSWSYSPLPHGVHEIAPVPAPVLVVEPAPHVVHEPVWLFDSCHSPAGQLEQD